MELKDKVVLITGSSQGIGKDAAILFSKESANVVVTYNTNKKKAEEVFNECNKIAESLLVHLDITDEESIKECVEKTIDKFGAIDILVNNAGVISWKEFLEQSNKEIDLQINVNYRGLVKMTKAVLPFMKAQDFGMIINISSGAGKQGFSGLTTYCGTKFAVRGFTQAMSQELPKKIKIFSVNPGMTATKMTNFQGINPRKVAEVILKTAKEEIKPDSFGDVDVWKYSFDAKVNDAVFGAKKKIGEFFG
ncbi:MAG: SDR family oxidoreductase [Nanoarchaeota archaeon]